MADESPKGNKTALLGALAIPAMIGVLVFGIAAFSGGASGPNALGRTMRQPASPADARIAKTISILSARIDTCAAIEQNRAAIDNTMGNLNLLAQDLSEKKATDGSLLYSSDQIDRVSRVASDAIAELRKLIDITKECGQSRANEKAADSWNKFLTILEPISNGQILGEPLYASIEYVDQNFSDDNDTLNTLTGSPVDITRIYQWDYADVPYPSATNSSGTVRTRGCGVIAMAMAVTRYDSTPANQLVRDLASFSVNRGYASGFGTSDAFYFTAARKYGLSARELMPRGAPIDAHWSKITDALRSGAPVIVSGKGGRPFTRGGHFIVLTGIDADGKIRLFDGRRSQSSLSYAEADIKGMIHSARGIYR